MRRVRYRSSGQDSVLIAIGVSLGPGSHACDNLIVIIENVYHKSIIWRSSDDELEKSVCADPEYLWTCQIPPWQARKEYGHARSSRGK